MRNSTTREVEKLETAMAERPPYIVWEHNGRGVQIAVLVEDPYLDIGYRTSRKDGAA